MTEALKGLGSRFRHARLSAGLSQAEVATRAGVSRQLVGRVEAGANGEIRAYMTIAAVLELQIWALPQEPLNASELAAIDLSDALRRGEFPAPRP